MGRFCRDFGRFVRTHAADGSSDGVGSAPGPVIDEVFVLSVVPPSAFGKLSGLQWSEVLRFRNGGLPVSLLRLVA